MADTTGISWADATFNPWIGCTKVSPGCDRCYAEALDRNRYSRNPAMGGGTKEVPISHWGAGAPRHRTSRSSWERPRQWNERAFRSGKPFRVFCASLADVFDNEVPDEWRTDLWKLIAETPDLTWMLLTKRIGNVTYAMPANVWLGISVVNQAEADRDIPKLLQAQAPVRFLSCEPLLGPIDLSLLDRTRAAWRDVQPYRRLDWIIVGGESGKGARPMEIEWARSLRDQCAARGIPFHFKQWGEWRGLARLGTRAAGHLLDGVEHRAFP